MKDIAGFEGLYAATSCGRIWSYKSNKFLRQHKNTSGYLQVCLYRNGKQKFMYVHRLVAQAYIPNPKNYEQINHKDENPENNCLQNLEWCDAKYNVNYGTRNKRAAETQINHPKKSKKIICVETGEIFPSTKEVERKIGIHQPNIVACCKGRLKQTGGYTFRYLEV